VVASLYLAMAYVTLGNYTRATKFARKNIGLLRGNPQFERYAPHLLHAPPAIFPRTLLVWSLAELGEFAEAQPVIEEGLRIARTLDHPYSQTFLSLGEGILRLRQGNLPGAVSTLERSLALCRHWKLLNLFDVIVGHLGAAYTLAGRPDEAIPLLEESLAREQRLWLEPIPALALGEAYLRAGQMEKAAQLAHRTLDLARRRGQRGYEAWVRRLLGEIAARSGNALAPEDHYRQALALATELGMRPLAAHCHLGLGHWLRRSGDAARGEEHLTLARTMYGEMGLTLWLAQVEVEPAVTR
jgi:tetratricopeptide (TPR) repeat protein